MADSNISIEITAKNLETRQKLHVIIRSVEGLHIRQAGEQNPPDLLIFELGKDIETDFEVIESLIQSNAVSEVFLTSEKTDPSLLLKAMRTGAKEFFSQPLKEEEIRQAIERFKIRREKLSHREPAKSGQIIDVIGAKGGVGTTTVAVNLAVSLAEKKPIPSVALIDMNMLFGEIPLFLDIRPRYHWGDITKDIDRLDPTFLMNILTKHSSGVHVLPSPSFLNGHEVPSPDIISRLLQLMQRMFDFVVIDGGQSLDEISLKILQTSDNVFLISLLSLPCLSNTNKLLRFLITMGYLPRDRIKIVVNRYQKKAELSLRDAEASIKNKIFWLIPNDYKTTLSAINQGKALCRIASKAPTTKSLKELADFMTQGQEERGKRRWKFLNS